MNLFIREKQTSEKSFIEDLKVSLFKYFTCRILNTLNRCYCVIGIIFCSFPLTNNNFNKNE